MDKELLIFVGYASDAKEEAEYIYKLEQPLQKSLTLLSKGNNSYYSRLKIFIWDQEATLGVGGQKFAIGPHLEKASIAIFVFKNRVGTVTWKELNFSRNKRTPIITLFPEKNTSPDRLNEVEPAKEWLNLLEKKRLLTEDWTKENSLSVTPVEPYKNSDHIERILKEKLPEIFSRIIQEKVNSTNNKEGALITNNQKLSTDFDLDHLSPISEYNLEIVKEYRSNLREDIKSKFPESIDSHTFLSELGYLKNGFLTYTGVLLFCSNPSAILPIQLGSAEVRVTKFEGKTNIAKFWKRDEYSSPINKQISEVWAFIQKNIESKELVDDSSMMSKVTFKYPMKCLREVIANALVHRDYSDQGRVVYVRIYDDHITIANPGKWLKSNTIPQNKFIPLSRLAIQPNQQNIGLSKAISSIGYMEMIGRGIANSIQDCKEINAAEPEVTEEDGYVIVRVYPSKNWQNSKGIKKQNKPRKAYYYVAYTVVGLVLALTAIGWGYFGELLNKKHEVSFFKDLASYNILLLPFGASQYCTDQIFVPERELKNRLNILEEQDNNLDIEVQLFHGINNLRQAFSFERAKAIGDSLRSDLVVFGDYQSKCEWDSMKIRVKWASLQTDIPFLGQIDQGYKTIQDISQIEEGGITGNVEEVIYWFSGLGEYKAQKFRNALNYFQKIEKKEKKEYLDLYFHIGNCFYHIGKDANDIDILNRGVDYYSKTIELDSSYVEAYYNRGLVYRILGQPEKAKQDQLKVQELKAKATNN